MGFGVQGLGYGVWGSVVGQKQRVSKAAQNPGFGLGLRTARSARWSQDCGDRTTTGEPQPRPPPPCLAPARSLPARSRDVLQARKIVKGGADGERQVVQQAGAGQRVEEGAGMQRRRRSAARTSMTNDTNQREMVTQRQQRQQRVWAAEEPAVARSQKSARQNPSVPRCS